MTPYKRNNLLDRGVETQICDEGGMNVCDIENGDYIKISVDFGEGAKSFAVGWRRNAGRPHRTALDSPTGTLIGTCCFRHGAAGKWKPSGARLT